jgi:hypothetical protein
VSARWKIIAVEMVLTSLRAAAVVVEVKVVVEVVEVDNSTGAPVVTEVLGLRAEGGDGEAGGWGFFSPVEVMVVVVVDGVVVVVVCAGAAVGADVVGLSGNAVGMVLDSAGLVGATGTAGLEVTVAVVVLDLLLASSGIRPPA